VNHKKIKRLMREHGLQPPWRRRFVVTTDSDHDQPIFPNRTRELAIDGPDQLWVADLTYVAVAIGFVYIAAILDAWSRRIVGFAIGRRIDARLTLAALAAAIELRRPPPGCVHHSDRGSQGGFKRSSQHLDEGGCDEHSKAAFGSVWAGAIVVTRSTAGGRTRRAATVLGSYRGRHGE
jgi:putative transposase